LTATASIDVTADSRRGLNYSLKWAELLPNWSAIDFIKNYCTFKNMMVSVNEFTREALILPYSSFYTTTAKDWTDNLITSEKISVVKFNTPASYVFRFEKDNNDITFVDGDNEQVHKFDDPTTGDMQLKVPFALTYFDGAYRIVGLSRSETIPLILEGTNSPDAFVERKMEHTTRILKVDSITSLVSGFTFEGSSYTNWWEFSDDDITPAEMMNNYSGQLRNMEYSKVLTASFHVPAYELQNYLLLNTGDFRTPEHIDGEFYYLIDIKGWNTETERAICTLLQINDKDIEL
jgi:hypothetical protein